jgi:Flp pilus assembly protein TadG
MTPLGPRPAPLAVLGRFATAEEGGHAVEFALVSGVFVTLILAVCQYALVYMARDSLELALQQAVRTVMTGAFQQANAGLTDQAQILRNLQATICGPNLDSHNWMFNCATLKLDLRSAGSFATTGGASSAVDAGSGTWASDFGTTYSCPGPQSVAVLRAAVKYPVFAPGLRLGLGTFADGSALVQAAAVFRVEPYQSGTGTSC